MPQPLQGQRGPGRPLTAPSRPPRLPLSGSRRSRTVAAPGPVGAAVPAASAAPCPPGSARHSHLASPRLASPCLASLPLPPGCRRAEAPGGQRAGGRAMSAECSSYLNADKVLVSGFSCPRAGGDARAVFCCGFQDVKYCCDDPHSFFPYEHSYMWWLR